MRDYYRFIKYQILSNLKKFIYYLIIFLSRSNKEHQKFCILVASYNNEDYCIKNLLSIENQEYSQFRVIYINDNSSDLTMEKVNNFIKKSIIRKKFMIIESNKRNGSLLNKYKAIHEHCNDDEIIISLDGDDYFSNNYVLRYLNNLYSKKNIYMTFGSFRYLSGKVHFQRKYSDYCIKNNLFRETTHPSHLRSYYAWIFKKINKVNFLDRNGLFFKTCEDRATMYPLIELSGFKHKFIPFELIIYNDLNPIGLHNVNNLETVKKSNREQISKKHRLKAI